MTDSATVPTSQESLTLDDDLGVRPRAASRLPDEQIVEVMHAWAVNLDSGEFLQGRQHLRSFGDRYCCLGVLIETLRRHGLIEGDWEQDPGSDVKHFMGHSGLLPDIVSDMLGLGDGGTMDMPQNDLWYSPRADKRFVGMTDANDSLRLTFPEIASAVRFQFRKEGVDPW